MELKSEQVEQITPHLQRYRLLDGRIVVYVATDSGSETVDAWYDAVLQELRDWPEELLYLELQDLRAVVPGPYNQKRALDLIRRMSYREGRSVTMISTSAAGRVIAYFVNHVFAPFTGQMKRRVCFTVDEGLGWLREGLDDAKC